MATYNGHNEDSSGNILLSIGNGMTAKVETGTTASQAYTKGALLFFNNRLCKATKAISSGATLAVGTNLSQTSLGAELTSHLRSSDGKEFYFDVKDGTYGYYPSASKVSSEFVPFGGTALPKTPTSSSKKNITTTNNDQHLVQLTNNYSTIYGSHNTGGSCAVNLYFYDENGDYISYLDTILSMPNVTSSSASISVPSNAAYVGIGIRGAGTMNADVWFS